MFQINHYNVLEVNQDATTDEITTSYQNNIRQCTPSDDAQKQSIIEAYSVLSCTHKRTLHDFEIGVGKKIKGAFNQHFFKPWESFKEPVQAMGEMLGYPLLFACMGLVASAATILFTLPACCEMIDNSPKGIEKQEMMRDILQDSMIYAVTGLVMPLASLIYIFTSIITRTITTGVMPVFECFNDENTAAMVHSMSGMNPYFYS